MSITDDFYAREADRLARGPQLYGGNATIVQLRCFKYYHHDARSTITDPGGVERWMAPKQARVYAIAHRLGTSGESSTMTAIASEAMCCVSTVSRALTKLQAWGFFGVDTKRGRNGGITVRMRTFGDSLKHYADAAWRRIRSWINVASTHKEGSRGVSVRTTTTKDATFSEVPWTFTSKAADEEWARAEQWARDTITEIKRLNAGEPDWDVQLDLIRASIGWPSA